ncbi:hypothetical protein AVEN_199723-1, partial [Araneus ventricosus]
GRTGKNATLDKVRAAGITDPMVCFNHGLWVSVPGTIAGMVKVVEEFGSGKVRPFVSLSAAMAMQNLLAALFGDGCHMWCLFVTNHVTGVKEDGQHDFDLSADMPYFVCPREYWMLSL